MKKQNIYIVQFGSGASINLLPLAAGQLYSRLKIDNKINRQYNLPEIIFQRPQKSETFATQLSNVFAIGFSCFLWNMNISLQAAKSVKEYFPDAFVVFGGPSIPKDPHNSEDFLNRHPFIDAICIGEGEDVFVRLCHARMSGEKLSAVSGIIYREETSLKVCRTGPEILPVLENLPSPYLDGTFDILFSKYSDDFSGIILETNRGCPFRCAYCTWGNLSSHRIREKPIDIVKREVEWIGKNKIKYIAMSDSNFGIRKRDVQVAKFLAECKKKYGAPNFISVSWVKNSSDKVLKIANIFKKSGIGFRVTLSLQSLNPDVIRVANRSNLDKTKFQKIKSDYHQNKFYSYTELILGLPLETQETFLDGLDQCLSNNVFHQLYVYPCLLFPNTALASADYRKKYKIEGKMIPNRYTKNKEFHDNQEQVEMVVGTGAMPAKAWRDSFVIGYYTLGLYDDRLAFFILQYLKEIYSIASTELIKFARQICHQKELGLIRSSFRLLEETSLAIQRQGKSHLIEPQGFDSIPFDPPEGVFLELLLNKKQFYDEFFIVAKSFLKLKKIPFDAHVLSDLFCFQDAVMAHPNGPYRFILNLHYNWIDYFGFAFGQQREELQAKECTYTVIDPKPSHGKPLDFLKNHFDIRGIPAFKQVYNKDDKLVFPLF